MSPFIPIITKLEGLKFAKKKKLKKKKKKTKKVTNRTDLIVSPSFSAKKERLLSPPLLSFTQLIF